jgi:hypothetical protein
MWKIQSFTPQQSLTFLERFEFAWNLHGQRADWALFFNLDGNPAVMEHIISPAAAQVLATDWNDCVNVKRMRLGVSFWNEQHGNAWDFFGLPHP